MGDGWFAFGEAEKSGALDGIRGQDCDVCGRKPDDTAMVYKQERWCSENHRKVFEEEVEPTKAEWESMNGWLYMKLRAVWDD